MSFGTQQVLPSEEMLPIKYGFTAQQVLEEGRVTREDINLIRSWLDTQKLPELTDEQIVLFLLSCCSEHEFTRKTISCFYAVRNGYPELFDNRRLERKDLVQQLNTLNYCVLPVRTDDDCAIVFHGVNDPVYYRYEMAPSLKLLFMTLDAAVYDHPPKGLVVIYDMKGAGLMHLTRIRAGLVQPYCKYLEDCLPVRLKSVHIFNTVFFIEKLMILVRPFIKGDIMSMLNFHPSGMEMEPFYEKWLPRRCLPEDYGGDLPPLRTLHENHVKKLAEMQSFFDLEERQRHTIKK